MLQSRRRMWCILIRTVSPIHPAGEATPPNTAEAKACSAVSHWLYLTVKRYNDFYCAWNLTREKLHHSIRMRLTCASRYRIANQTCSRVLDVIWWAVIFQHLKSWLRSSDGILMNGCDWGHSILYNRQSWLLSPSLSCCLAWWVLRSPIINFLHYFVCRWMTVWVEVNKCKDCSSQQLHSWTRYSLWPFEEGTSLLSQQTPLLKKH